jgi:hypothetical protein
MVQPPKTTGATKAKFIFVFAVGFLAFQFIVPAVLLSAPRPARLGWQMFSGVTKSPSFWVVTTDGVTNQINLADQVGYARLDIDYLSKIPRHLCDTEPNVVSVRYQTANDTAIEEYPCR